MANLEFSGNSFSFNLILAGSRYRILLSALVYGLAVATHNSALFTFPVMIYLLYIRKKKSLYKGLLRWTGISAVTILFFCIIIYMLYPAKTTGNHLLEFLSYIRGIAPGIDISGSISFKFLSNSIVSLFKRLIVFNDLSLTPVHFIFSAIGSFYCFRIRRESFNLLMIYMAPYLAYEIMLGINLDHGLYIPFFLIPFFFLLAQGIYNLPRITGKKIRKRTFWIYLLIVLLILVTPSLGLIIRNLDKTEIDKRDHFSGTVPIAVWMDENLPEDAVVIQPRDEWNVNLLPYYSNRRHIYRFGEDLMIFNYRGPFTPMNENSYSRLTTSDLEELIISGGVYSVDENPLDGYNTGILDKSSFIWMEYAIFGQNKIYKGTWKAVRNQ